MHPSERSAADVVPSRRAAVDERSITWASASFCFFFVSSRLDVSARQPMIFRQSMRVPDLRGGGSGGGGGDDGARGGGGHVS